MENRPSTISARTNTAFTGRQRPWKDPAPRRETPVPETPPPAPCAAVKNAVLFFELSRIVKQNLDLEKILEPALECMAMGLGLYRAEVHIQESTGGILEASFDGVEEDAKTASPEALNDLREWVGRTAKPAAMLWGMENACAVALLCVPILLEERVVGALCAERVVRTETPPNEGLKSMEGVASILARAILFCRSTFERAAALKQENQGLSERLAHHFRPAGMVGDSDKMQAVYERIVHVAPTELPVLIRGEKGTGKKDVARALHEGSFRRGRALVKVDCASLPETTVEAHAGGDPAPGISGALLMLSGCLKMAQGGTLLLDHVDRLSATAQARLLRVIQKKEFEQTGSMESFSCDVRIIGATSAPLEELVDSGEFRRDFFQALVACSVRLPALCERRDDILQLTQHFLDQFAARHRKKIQRVSPAVVDLLLAYDWPGNVGELCTCLEKAVLLCGDGVLRANHFPPRLYACVDPQGTEAGLLDSAIAALEHDMVVDALTLHRGNISAAARQLGTTERIMGCRIKKYGLDMKRFAGMQAEALPA